jgi:hypothetical protein
MMPQPGSALHSENRSARIPTTGSGGAGPGGISSLDLYSPASAKTIEQRITRGGNESWPGPLLSKICRGAV